MWYCQSQCHRLAGVPGRPLIVSERICMMSKRLHSDMKTINMYKTNCTVHRSGLNSNVDYNVSDGDALYDRRLDSFLPKRQ